MRRATTSAKFTPAALLTLIVLAAAPLMAQDTDADGLPDDVEKRLGTLPDTAEELELIAEDKLTDIEEGGEPRHDITEIRFANVAKGRWLWAIEFDAPHDPDNTIVTLYVDADADPDTGRPDMGCEVAYVNYAGRTVNKLYVEGPDAERYPPGRTASVDGVVYFCADLPLKQENGRSVFSIRVHAQTVDPAQVRDRFGFQVVEGAGDSDREPPEVPEVGVVEGIVVDEDGKPVTGARVRGILTPAREPVDPFSPGIDAETDDQGRFRAQAEPGTYYLNATRGLLTSDKAPWDVRRIVVGLGSVLSDLRIPLQPGGRVRGTVVHKGTGEPVAGAQIVLGTGLTTVADDEGKFELAGVGLGEHRVKALAPGLADGGADINTEGHDLYEVTVEMSPGFTVRGAVTDEQGNPVAGALVRDHYSGHIIHCWMRRYVTGEDGKYELHGYSRARKLWSLGVEHPDFASQSKHDIQAPAEGDSVTIDWVLNKGYGVEGIVLDAEGNPVSGAKVAYNLSECYVHYKATTTDAQGRFRLDKLASDRQEYILVQAKGYAPAYQQAKPDRGDAVPELTFNLEPGHTAEGRVVDRAGNPIVGAAVSPQMSVAGRCGSDYIASRVTTDAEGRFKLDSLPGTGVTADAWRTGYSPVRDLALKLDGEESLIVMDPPGVIVGKVVDADTGQPVKEFNVKLGFPSGGRLPGEPSGGFSCHLSSRGQDCRSDEGLFTIEDLICRAGLAVIVTADGYAPARVDRVTVRPADSEEWPVVINLGKGLTLSGQVTAADTGKALPDAEVVLLMPTPGRGWRFEMQILEDPSRYGYTVQKTRPDEQGRFEFKGVTEDAEVQLLARHHDYAPLLLKEFDRDRPIEAKLPLGGNILGTVAGYGDLRMDGAYINIYSEVMNYGRAPLSDDGSFGLDNVPPGEYRITIMEPAEDGRSIYSKRSIKVQVTPGETTNVDFGALPGVKVRGTLTLGGEPFPGADTELYDASDRDFRVTDHSGADGRFTLERIPPGEYRLSAMTHSWDDPMRRGYSARAIIKVGDQDVTRDLQFNPGKIVGRILRPDSGEGLQAVEIKATRIMDDPQPDYAIGAYRSREGELRFTQGSTSWQTFTGMRLTRALGSPSTEEGRGYGQSVEQGRFEVVNVAAGEYLLTLTAPDSVVPAFTGPIAVAKGAEPPSIEVKLDASAVLSLKIADADTKKAIADARLHLCTADGSQLAHQLRRPRLLTLEQAAAAPSCPTCGPGRSEYTYEDMQSNKEGLVSLDGLQPADYGVWVIASGYAARLVAPLKASPDAGNPIVIELQPTGVLLLKPAAQTLEGVTSPYVLYHITNAQGQPVFPGGENQSTAVLETGAAWLVGDNAEGYRVDVLAPGNYSIEWEIQRGPDPEDASWDSRKIRPPVLNGKADFEIRRGEETIVELGK